MKANLVCFYLMGRGVKSLARIRKYAIDAEEVVEALLANPIEEVKVRDAISTAADAAARELRADQKRKKAWIAENKDEIALAFELDRDPISAESEQAWDMYIQGVSDELAYSMEPEVLDELEELQSDEDEDEDEESEENGDDDGEDEDHQTGAERQTGRDDDGDQ